MSLKSEGYDLEGLHDRDPIVVEARSVRGRSSWTERPATRDPTTVLPVPQAGDVLVEGSMNRLDIEGRMPMGAPWHQPPVTRFGRADCASASPSTVMPKVGSAGRGSVE
jgi:hypothetical protein